jgi:leader peptidase (prepilin peptidase)/N-methyltransferase
VPLLGAVAAGGGLFVVFALVTLVAPKAMAFGDVRLAGVVGSALGWWGLGRSLLV